MMWLLCDGNEDMGKWGTGVMRTIEQCSMANGSLCSGGNNSFKHCFTAHISPQSVFDCCYITSSQSWHHGSFRRVEVELTARAAINDNVALCWSLTLDSGGCCSGHGEGVVSGDHDWSTGAMQQAASVYSISIVHLTDDRFHWKHKLGKTTSLRSLHKRSVMLEL